MSVAICVWAKCVIHRCRYCDVPVFCVCVVYSCASLTGCSSRVLCVLLCVFATMLINNVYFIACVCVIAYGLP